jgi:hypothetical protein
VALFFQPGDLVYYIDRFLSAKLHAGIYYFVADYIGIKPAKHFSLCFILPSFTLLLELKDVFVLYILHIR